jgi:anti-sigma factor RsiW
VSHLGDQLSALVDGELSGTELDRANAHVAACGACRVEANALRQLKHQLRSLAEVSEADDITRRLLEMAGEADSEADRTEQATVWYLNRERGQRRLPAAYAAGPGRRRLTGHRRGRYVLWSTVSLVVVGIGTAAFGMGGASGSATPQVKPQLEVFDVQHALFSGDIPFEEPGSVPSRVPAVAATP